MTEIKYDVLWDIVVPAGIISLGIFCLMVLSMFLLDYGRGYNFMSITEPDENEENENEQL